MGPLSVPPFWSQVLSSADLAAHMKVFSDQIHVIRYSKDLITKVFDLIDAFEASDDGPLFMTEQTKCRADGQCFDKGLNPGRPNNRRLANIVPCGPLTLAKWGESKCQKDLQLVQSMLMLQQLVMDHVASPCAV